MCGGIELIVAYIRVEIHHDPQIHPWRLRREELMRGA